MAEIIDIIYIYIFWKGRNVMKRTIKILSLAAAGMMAFQAAAFADFSDMPSGDMGTALQNAVDNGLITGYDDGTIRADEKITRAQMAAIITRAFGAEYKDSSTFPDVAADAWYAEDVSKASYMGAFGGDSEGNFNPENNITFQETYTVLARVFCFDSYYTNNSDGSKDYVNKADLAVLDSFSDKDSVADWAADYTAGVVQYGGYQGIDGQLKGSDEITRGEFALIMDSLVGTYIDSTDNISVDPSKSVMVRATDAGLSGLKTDRNLIIGYSVDQCTLQDAEIAGTTVVYGCIDQPNATSTDNLKSKISLGGTFNDVRIKSAGIFLDASGAKMKSIRGVSNSRINMGTFGG